ncbi:restriction endonuclease subunit S [Corynebacterium sputi]|uniref:restriction endonuclease subunit S n=1 Tax=Corynebacterium sputi TaxID=489915 RepID=UPI000420F72C|nr:restriction endonuclease subunit S [Corynebacterium sputi]
MRDGWIETTLGEVTAVNPGRLKGVSPDDVIRYVDISSVSWDTGIDICSVAEMPFGQAPGRARRPINEKDVVVSTVRPRLRAMGQVPPSLAGQVASTGLCVLRARDSEAILPDYVWQVVRHHAFTDWLVERETGSNYPAVRSSDIEAYPFLLPPIEEQRRIVDLMSHMDAVIERLAEEFESVERMARSLRNEAFGAWSDQFELAPAASLFGMLLGRQKSARQSVGSHVIPYIRSGNIADGFLRLDDVQEMNFEPDEQHKYAISSGDVLLAEGGTVGQSALWKEEIQGPVGFDKHVIRLRPVEGMSTTNYIHQWCRWAFETGLFRETAKGVTISALGFGRAKALPVPKVPFEDQQGQTATLVAADALGQQLAAERSQLLQARAALLSELLSGLHQIPTSYDEFIRDEGAA